MTAKSLESPCFAGSDSNIGRVSAIYWCGHVRKLHDCGVQVTAFATFLTYSGDADSITRVTWLFLGKIMKKIALAAAALVIGTASASAADLAARPYTKAPAPIAAVYNWTGFYIGASGGGAWSDTRWQYFGAAVNTNHDGDGWFAGGQIGYNWQAGSWVFGVEADGHWADINGSTLCPNPAFVCATDVRTLASFRGRIGYAAGPVLFYGTGGAGFADTRYSATTPGGPNFFYTADRWGYAAGAGIEWGFAPNWSAKVEYMHYGFDAHTAPIGALSGVSSADLRLDIDTVKVGINYRFGGPGPVVARY